MRIAVSSYSFHRFGGGPEGDTRPPFAGMIEACARLGTDGLELLGVHFDSTDPGFLHDLKRKAVSCGVDLVSVSAHHNFVHPDAERRREEIAKLNRCVDLAYEIGAPVVRAFGGRWATRPQFAEFMAAGGIEPPLEGYTDDDGYAWSAEAFREACRYAGDRGVTLALENHWGFTGDADGVLRILKEVDSPWLKLALDTGNFNFCPDPYVEMARLAPHAIMIHAKTYFGGGIYYTADLDYPRIARLVRDAGFQGYWSIEFEGRAHPDTGIPESVGLLKGLGL